MALPPEVREKYITIIDSILAASDLTTISEKRVRKGIQEAVQYDVTPQKAAIKELIMERWDMFNAKLNRANTEKVNTETVALVETPVTNGHTKKATPPTQSPSRSPAKREAESEDLSELATSPPPKKKQKAVAVDADAAFAAKLQAEENMLARPTRGGSSRKAAPTKKKTPKKKKTKNKVSGEDDSDLETGSEKPKPKRTGGFHKPLKLSPALSELLGGEIILSRPETVSKIWKYIRANDLQDQSDKRQIICDAPMRAVFKQDKVHMFKMTKILNQNLYDEVE